MARQVEELRQEVRAAFNWRPRPEDDRIALGGPGCPGDEREDVARFFQGKDWREITLDSIIEGRELDLNAFLYFMSVEGFMYYLPAFLMASLEVDDRFDLGEPLAFKLTPPPGDSGDPRDPGLEAWRDQYAQIVSALTPEESRALTHVLEYLAREYEKRNYTRNQAQEALDSHWARLTGDLSS